MSKQVTIITRDLHKLTQYSSSLVACSNASRYSCDSGSKSWSTSTMRGTTNHDLLREILDFGVSKYKTQVHYLRMLNLKLTLSYPLAGVHHQSCLGVLKFLFQSFMLDSELSDLLLPSLHILQFCVKVRQTLQAET